MKKDRCTAIFFLRMEDIRVTLKQAQSRKLRYMEAETLQRPADNGQSFSLILEMRTSQ